ncbi:MAG: hypothetical protein F6K65_14790 [Moorea sp. SIO3C2]|uniref:hypothetical protein n=1 Tax=Moorena sp. SIO4E2 TaxID=2607826 RepID=UPI0013B74C59|nr:hypothetical protein [Moorena sp. SIO4E2]NEP50008.1 hypothetical protein [Moorena sp. SIO3C2]NEQ08329.1 hypothetical protein [Moorena sp. SIO4E2]
MPTVTTNENTYGFEIEFCTHDNTILRYTHVVIASIQLNGHGFEDDNEIPLKIETDSGDVLELVTPPIIFQNVKQATEFRNSLAQYLKDSVKDPLTFANWWSSYGKNIVSQMNSFYETATGSQPSEGSWIKNSENWDFTIFNNIMLNISVNNIDDGINIAAAEVRLKNIAFKDDANQAWKNELNQTVLSTSTKDWPEGYSTQTSIPMGVTEYVKYLISRKILKSNANLRRLADLLQNNQTSEEINETLQWDKVERWATTWFWGGVIFDLFYEFKIQVEPQDKTIVYLPSYTHFQQGNELKWSKNLGKSSNQTFNIEELSELDAVLFIIAQKTLTGALGSLSEQQQLKKQTLGDYEKNAAAMEQRHFVRQPDDDAKQYYWCEYHSGLKDLLNVWFKGHLADVLLLLSNDNANRLHKLHNPQIDGFETSILNIYKDRLHKVTNQLEKFKRMPFMPEFTFIDDDNMLDTLVQAHIKVIKSTLEFIWEGSEKWAQANRNQKFLDYSSGNTLWEGRKDTMIKPIKHWDEETKQYKTLFLVEHRNN